MIATINGITVSGTPEEIQRFKELNAKTVTITNVNIHAETQQSANDILQKMNIINKGRIGI